ncbi:MAG: hypothetical protein M0Q43_01435 [Methanothrix sp.]|jgi:hypothetical protein|nr:hypothetical protein [Methanothrix sp.]
MAIVIDDLLRPLISLSLISAAGYYISNIYFISLCRNLSIPYKGLGFSPEIFYNEIFSVLALVSIFYIFLAGFIDIYSKDKATEFENFRTSFITSYKVNRPEKQPLPSFKIPEKWKIRFDRIRSHIRTLSIKISEIKSRVYNLIPRFMKSKNFPYQISYIIIGIAMAIIYVDISIFILKNFNNYSSVFLVLLILLLFASNVNNKYMVGLVEAYQSKDLIGIILFALIFLILFLIPSIFFAQYLGNIEAEKLLDGSSDDSAEIKLYLNNIDTCINISNKSLYLLMHADSNYIVVEKGNREKIYIIPEGQINGVVAVNNKHSNFAERSINYIQDLYANFYNILNNFVESLINRFTAYLQKVTSFRYILFECPAALQRG